MSETVGNQSPELAVPEVKRRDFLYVGTGALAIVGGAVAAWPFIDNMNPSAEVLAISTTDIDLKPIEPGQRVTAVWRGRPIFIDYRTPERIARAKAEDSDVLKDPELDSARVQQDKWLIVVGVCTHLGCIPLGQKSGSPVGDWGGWFCPCHGSHYDTSGRIRKGPAPKNLVVPPYQILNNGIVQIG